MKSLIVACTLIASTCASAYEIPPPVPKRDTRNMTEEQKAEYYAARKAHKQALTGGHINNYAAQKGVVYFLNAQKRVPAEPLEKRLQSMRDYFHSRFEMKTWDKPITLGNAEETLKASGGNAAVFIVDDSTIPVTILSAPETKWIFLNVAALAADGADSKVVMERTRRELWRTLGFMLGHASIAEVCVMKPVTSLKELDELGAEAPSSGPLIFISRYLRNIGVMPYQISTYARALMEGWAPAPTNDIQKAVYERYLEAKKNGTLPKGKYIGGFLPPATNEPAAKKD